MTLDDYLKREGLSGPEFAKIVGVDPSTIWRIKKGKVLPHFRTLKAIVRTTDGAVTINDLISLKGDRHDASQS